MTGKPGSMMSSLSRSSHGSLLAPERRGQASGAGIDRAEQRLPGRVWLAQPGPQCRLRATGREGMFETLACSMVAIHNYGGAVWHGKAEKL
jgi:hypothetical protein